MDLAHYDTALAAFQNAAAALSGDQKPILKFEKGDWYAGADNEDMAHGTRFAADIMSSEWGWVLWRGGKPSDRRMVLVASGQKPEAREALGYLDEQLWDRDERTGAPRDPWQKMIEIPLREIEGERREMVLAGGSRGHEGACKALFKAFGEAMRSNMGKTPIIELSSGKYNHKQYGVVKVPVLNLVDWKSSDELQSEPSKPKAKTKF